MSNLQKSENESKILFFAENLNSKPVNTQILTEILLKKHYNIKKCTVNLQNLDIDEYLSIAQLKRKLRKPYNLRKSKTIHIINYDEFDKNNNI